MQTGKITALYVRFSFDDSIDTESGSIEHQKALLRNYAESNGFTNLSYYADDGYTGTNFNRPNFQRMMSDIKKGLVETVIVKDMSRLGRNYLMVGQYTELEFPKYGIRFIAINDNVDSDKGMNEFLPIHNLINEFYSRDISKKIRSTVRQKGNSGQAVTSALPYGYIRNPQDKNEWIIDEYAGEIVRRIFDYYVNQMMSANEIAKILTSEKHLVPRVYRRARKGIEVDKTAYQWSVSTITQMLKHQEYVGDTVNFRYEITSYKNKKIICNGDDKIKIFPDTHPAIVSRELYQMAQDRREKTIRHIARPHKYIFKDFLYCKDCHARLHGRHCGGKEVVFGYECAMCRKEKGCYFHGVSEKFLKREVLKEIQRVLQLAKSNPDDFHNIIQRHLEKQSDGSRVVMQKEFEKAQLRITEIDKYIQGLFEAKVKGEIDGSLFASLKSTYDDEKVQLNKMIAEYIAKLNDRNDTNSKVKMLFAAIKKYDAIEELTSEVLADFIEYIEVGKCLNPNRRIPVSKRINDISVYFWGVGII